MSKVLIKTDLSDEVQRSTALLIAMPQELLRNHNAQIAVMGYRGLAKWWIICRLEDIYGFTIPRTIRNEALYRAIDSFLNKYHFQFLEQTCFPPNIINCEGYDYNLDGTTLTLLFEVS